MTTGLIESSSSVSTGHRRTKRGRSIRARTSGRTSGRPVRQARATTPVSRTTTSRIESWYSVGGDIAPQHPYSSSNDTWSYSYVSNTWTHLHPAKSPDRRLGSAMVYDSAADRVILFGGCANGTDFTCIPMNDTWIYHYAS